MKQGKLIVISAPSGSGKTSIVKALLEDQSLNLSFSTSVTTRHPRSNEKNGVDYFFVSKERFKELVNQDELIEWEEVYKDQYYGSLKQEVVKITNQGKNVIFDIDVVGGMTIKNKYERECLAIFIQAPSLNLLKQRLENRKTENENSLAVRIKKAKNELKASTKFDKIIINDNLNIAVAETKSVILNFLNQ